MSSYLNLYLVPKESKKPLLLNQYNRAGNIYHQFKKHLNPIYIGNGDEYQYEELTLDKVDEVIRETENEIKQFEKMLSIRMEAYNSVDIHSSEEAAEYTDNYIDNKCFISELKEAVQEIKFIRDIVYTIDLDCTDFEKILMNID